MSNKDFLSKELKRLLKLQTEVRPHLQGVPYWAAAALVGLVAVFYSGTFSACIDAVRKLYSLYPEALFVTSPLCFYLAAWLVERFSPPAGGTGIPHVIHAISLNPQTQSNEIHDYLRIKVAGIVILSSLLAVLGAGSLGREGPMVHIAACVFYFVGKQATRFWPYTEHRSWIIAGGAAGVAAAFNAPLAGVVFVLEELAQQHFHQFKTVVISAAIIGGLVSQAISGKYLYFGYPKVGDVYLSAIPYAAFAGVMCGVFAYPFQIMLKLDWKEKLPHFFQHRLKFAALIGLCMAALAYFVDPGTIGGGISVIEDLLFKNERASWSLILGRLVGTVLSHLSGCAGGFLAPSLALGAAIGSKLAELTSYSNHGLLVLVGMSAFLSANLGAPFTAWVIVLEMTDRHSAIFPLMVASLVAHATSSLLLGKKE